LFEQVDETTFCCQAHPEFSPVGWHLGHIAYIESLWLLERGAGLAPMFPQYRRLFVADGLPKSERVKLPNFEVICHYLNTVRQEVLSVLETVDLDQQERLWHWLIQHESQHGETIAFVLQLQRWQDLKISRGGFNRHIYGKTNVFEQPALTAPTSQTDYLDQMVEIPSGYFEQGNDSIDAMDNELPVHQVYLDTYWIDRYPVTCGQYRVFVAAGGYQNPRWWSEDGWKWLSCQQVKQPLYWSDDTQWDDRPVVVLAGMKQKLMPDLSANAYQAKPNGKKPQAGMLQRAIAAPILGEKQHQIQKIAITTTLPERQRQ
jgi:hypothetical protein